MSGKVESLMRDLTAAIREEVGALPDNVLTLGEELSAARARSRMSLQEVADASGFTKSHVWEVEKGRARNPTVGMIAGLSKALGVPFLRLAQAALNTAEAPPEAAKTGGARHCTAGQSQSIMTTNSITSPPLQGRSDQ